MSTEKWDYSQIKEYVKESFESFLPSGLPIEKVTSSVIYEYEDIVRENKEEGLMIFLSIFVYLLAQGKRNRWVDDQISLAIAQIDIESTDDPAFLSDLAQYERLCRVAVPRKYSIRGFSVDETEE